MSAPTTVRALDVTDRPMVCFEIEVASGGCLLIGDTILHTFRIMSRENGKEPGIELRLIFERASFKYIVVLPNAENRNYMNRCWMERVPHCQVRRL